MQDFKGRFYELYQFLGGYFHQFWSEVLEWKGEKPNFEAIVNLYKSSDSPEGIFKTTKELEDFLALNLSEKKISDIFLKCGIWYGPGHQNMNYRQWLEAILEILKQEKTPKSSVRFRNVSITPVENELVVQERPH